MPGVYISFPFCAQKCTFCNFASGVLPAELEAAYLDALLDEIRAYSWQWTPDTVYLGGGTPSRIAPDATAYFNRRATHNLLCLGFWRIPADGADAAKRGLAHDAGVLYSIVPLPEFPMSGSLWVASTQRMAISANCQPSVRSVGHWAAICVDIV